MVWKRLIADRAHGAQVLAEERGEGLQDHLRRLREAAGAADAGADALAALGLDVADGMRLGPRLSEREAAEIREALGRIVGDTRAARDERRQREAALRGRLAEAEAEAARRGAELEEARKAAREAVGVRDAYGGAAARVDVVLLDLNGRLFAESAQVTGVQVVGRHLDVPCRPPRSSPHVQAGRLGRPRSRRAAHC